MLKIIISILFFLLLLSVSFNIQVSSSEIGASNASIEKIIKSIGIKLSSVYPGLPYESINKFLNDGINNKHSNPNEILEQVNDMYSNINKYPCGIIAQSLLFNIITMNNLKYEHDCKDLKSEIYQNNIRDTTNPGLPTGNTNPGLPTGNTNPGLPTGNTNPGLPTGNTNPGLPTGNTNPGLPTGNTNPGLPTGNTNPGLPTGNTNPGFKTIDDRYYQ